MAPVPESLEWRSLALFGIGAALAVLASIVRGTLRAPHAAPVGDVAVWVADRGAGAVYGLDEHWIVARVLRVGSPLRVESAGDGGVWIVRSREAHARAGHDLVLASASGTSELAIEIDRCADLSTSAGGDSLCLEVDGSGVARAMRVARDGTREVLAEGKSLVAVAGLSSSIAVGTSDGELWRIRADGGRSCTVVARSIVDVAAGPRPDWVWVLDSGREVRLLDELDRIVWSAPTRLDALELAPLPNEEQVWVYDRDAPLARRIARSLEDTIECRDLGTTAIENLIAVRGGGLLAAFPGAIVCRDARGRACPGQGGFHTLVDLAPD